MDSSVGEEFALHADNSCNLDSGFLATDLVLSSKFRDSRPNHETKQPYKKKSSMNTVLFVNATIGFSKKKLFASSLLFTDVSYYVRRGEGCRLLLCNPP